MTNTGIMCVKPIFAVNFTKKLNNSASRLISTVSDLLNMACIKSTFAILIGFDHRGASEATL